jgi:hypothetical protein
VSVGDRIIHLVFGAGVVVDVVSRAAVTVQFETDEFGAPLGSHPENGRLTISVDHNHRIADVIPCPAPAKTTTELAAEAEEEAAKLAKKKAKKPMTDEQKDTMAKRRKINAKVKLVTDGRFANRTNQQLIGDMYEHRKTS